MSTPYPSSTIPFFQYNSRIFLTLLECNFFSLSNSVQEWGKCQSTHIGKSNCRNH
jgi:hypothetical protein